MDASDSTYRITGFQSPCAEYHEKILSLDERYLVNHPGIFIIEASGTSPKLGIRPGDKLIINRAETPRKGDLVLLVIQNEFKLTLFSPEELKKQDADTGDFIWGVVTTLLREFK
jgi:DNA polymerase V